MSEPMRGVIVAHAALAEALMGAVDRIVGLEDGVLTAVSNEGLAPPAIRERIVEAAGDGPAVVFSDLREGSCGMMARQICLSREDQVLLTGVNLTMLLDFVLNRHRPLDELVDRLVEKGRSAIQRIPERT